MTAKAHIAPHLILYAPFLSMNAGFPHLIDYFGSGAIPSVTTLDVTHATVADLRAALDAARVVVIDQSIINAATWPAINGNPYYHVIDARPRDHYREVLDRFLEAPVARVLLANSDLHDPREPALHEWLAPRIDALFWLFEKRPPALAEVPAAYRDPWMETIACPRELWCGVAKRFPVRVEAWFAVAESEMLEDKPRDIWQAAVPGAPYGTRAVARDSMARAGVRQAPFRPLSNALKLVGAAVQRTGPSIARSRALIQAHWRLQRLVVRRSSVTFVCGSGLRYPVRKFIEIPANQGVLLAYPCIGLEDFGFRDGVNAVFTTPEDAGSATVALLRNDALRSTLRIAGMETVSRLHTVPRRAADLAQCLTRLQQGTLRGAQFVDGRFEIH